MRKRPVTTLFMLTSLDGKISTGATDELDVDIDFPKFAGLKEGLYQYYEIQETTDPWSLNSGRVQQKMGVNEKPLPDHHWDVSFVLLDNHHLNVHGVEYFCALSKLFVLVTSNPNHPAFSIKKDNLSVLYYEDLNFTTMLEDLHEKYDCERLTIQSGATLNAEFLRNKLFDFVDVVVAPVLIGGTETASLIGGTSFHSPNELEKLGILRLEKADVLKDSYLRLRYKVIG
ncbi:MAG: dihydrofolate reductase family protein [Prevotella sp.]|jgi:2,5-diamino-6-(ribosylamino)-4(3H)-pyrimidinone 5'-phosphate reductase|nr:dihydrofolate reductase family protein [Prevotella sp.]